MAKKKRRKNKYTNLNTVPDTGAVLYPDSYEGTDAVGDESGIKSAYEDAPKPREVREVTVDDYSDSKKAPDNKAHKADAEKVSSDNNKSGNTDESKNEHKSLVDKFLEENAPEKEKEPEKDTEAEKVAEEEKESESEKTTDKEKTTESEKKSEIEKTADKEELTEKEEKPQKKRSLVDIFLEREMVEEELDSDDTSSDDAVSIKEKEQELEQVFDEFTGELPLDEIEAGLVSAVSTDTTEIIADSVMEEALNEVADEVSEGEMLSRMHDGKADYAVVNEMPTSDENLTYDEMAGLQSQSGFDEETEAAEYNSDDEVFSYPPAGEPDKEVIKKGRRASKRLEKAEKRAEKKAEKAEKAAKNDKKADRKADGKADQKEGHDNRISAGLRAGIISVAAVSVIVAAVTGSGIALYEMDRTPAEVMALATGNASKSVDGLKFIDADDESDGGLTFYDSEDDGLTFIDADDDGLTFIDPDESDGLTFIDANEPSEAEPSDAASDEQMAAGENTGISEDGTQIEVTSEMADVATVIMAGSDQELTVATLNQTLITDPNANYPLPFTKVDESYFNDALFVGDSRLQGFGMWSGLPGTYYCATSFNISQYKTFKVVQTGNGKVPIFSALPYNAFTKIYIKVGLNEMGGSEEAFEATYAQMIAELRAMEPRAIIYIHAILPVTAGKSATSRTHNNVNITARNECLKQFAITQKAYYIDVGPVVSDETGCLKAESAADGIHMSSKYMGPWKQFLLDNAVVVQ